MTTTIQQTNNNQTATFLRTPTAHQKANVLSEKRRKPNDYVCNYSNEALGLEVYVSADGLVAMGFKGKAIKASFHYRFKTVEATKAHVEKFVSGVEKAAAEKAAYKAERKAKVRALTVGDVLVSSWGWEQTNIDYYQVIELVGKASVQLQQIAKQVTHERGDCGQCVPLLNNFIGEVFTKKVTDGERVTLTSYSSARRKDYIMAGGIKAFKPDYWSSYA